ncbi:MAG: metallophosphoesterase [Anaeroplasmataceae bacterium]|nr:metallophosphoesterase [Anaeroplasmataceae bacterium]
MNKTKSTKVLNLNLPTNKRFLFMSDIHGDIKLFKQALHDVNFSDDDYLFVIGDMIEKGDFLDNISMLDYIIELNQKPNVYFMSGNCDEVFRFILPPLDKEKFLYYALDKQKSIINDLANRLNYSLHQSMDIEDFIALIQKSFPQYYSFIEELPDVIFINDLLVLVHGGIEDIHNIPKNSIDVLKFDRFLELSKPQPKTMIVGHYPTRNYRSDIACVNPIFDSRKNIISIDGGNNVVKGGQLNVVILDSLETMRYSFVCLDHYPKYQIEEDIYYEHPKNFYSMRYGKNEVKVLTKDLDFYLIQPIDSEDLLWVNEEFIFKVDHKFYCYDGSNTFLSLKKGDQISIIKKAKPYSLIKHEGVIGLIESKYIHEDQL